MPDSCYAGQYHTLNDVNERGCRYCCLPQSTASVCLLHMPADNLYDAGQDELEVTSWDEMFSRGIDPDVLDPSKCHGHPDAPAEWPTKQEITAYSLQARTLCWHPASRFSHVNATALRVSMAV